MHIASRVDVRAELHERGGHGALAIVDSEFEYEGSPAVLQYARSSVKTPQRQSTPIQSLTHGPHDHDQTRVPDLYHQDA
jgi:hypothetical protein